MYIPGLTILLKIPLVMPGISCYLDKIRGGWERKSAFKNNLSGVTLTNTLTDSSKNKTYNIAMPDENQSSGRVFNVRST